MAMQGIDTILQHLANASGALERSARPGIKEVKEAAGSAKIAADLLKASETFLQNGIYVICDEPASAYIDPAAHKIEMPEVDHIELDESAPVELPPMPDLFTDGFKDESPEDQKVAFESALEDLDGAGLEKLPDVNDWEDAPWWAAFDADPIAAWHKLMFSVYHREPFSFEVPSDEEFATWRAGFAQDAPEEAPQEEPDQADQAEEAEVLAGDCKVGLAEFEKMLDKLEEAGTEEGLKRKDWKKAHKAWWVAQDLDPLGTFSKLQAALAAPTISWAVPADKEEEAI